MADTKSSWEKFLHPETLRSNLIAIALFISAFEMFKDRVIEKPETFFSNGFDQNGLIIDEKYKIEVLSKSKSRLYASLLWFSDRGRSDLFLSSYAGTTRSPCQAPAYLPPWTGRGPACPG